MVSGPMSRFEQHAVTIKTLDRCVLWRQPILSMVVRSVVKKKCKILHYAKIQAITCTLGGHFCPSMKDPPLFVSSTLKHVYDVILTL